MEDRTLLQASGGPLILMGIDAEDGGVGGHGPIGVYESVTTSILTNTTNGGSGILVIGGGKVAGDDVSQFWSRIGSDLGVSVTFVNGAGNIASQSFAGFAMIGVVSDVGNTPGGGLTNAENDALTLRFSDIGNFVSFGGGLLGFSSDLNTPYGYLGALASFTFRLGQGYSDITPTPAGLAIGITNALDVSAWHDTYLTFPSFMNVLATNAQAGVGFGEAAAIGGLQVVILPLDFGDAPNTYGTLVGSNGARHVTSGLLLGTARDAETDAPGLLLNGTGDDVTSVDDEDGVTFH